MKLMCSLLQKQKFTLGGLFFPRVGHSHGALGDLAATLHGFGLLAIQFLNMFMFNDPTCCWDVLVCCPFQDQCFGILARCVKYVDLLADPSDLILPPENIKKKAEVACFFRVRV